MLDDVVTQHTQISHDISTGELHNVRHSIARHELIGAEQMTVSSTLTIMTMSQLAFLRTIDENLTVYDEF